MTAATHPLLPRATADRVAWGCVAAGAAAVVAALAQFWGANPGHADRFLVLLGAAYAAYTLSPAWSALPVRPRPVLGLPLVLVGAPVLDTVRLAGIPVSWLAIAVLPYPLLALLAAWQLRKAERVERSWPERRRVAR
jgi:hypothetical protein